MQIFMGKNLGSIDDFFAISDNEKLASILLNFIEENIESISPNWHALGFIHCLLASEASGVTLRLHAWDSGLSHNQEQESKIHDHRFDVESRVLSGAVMNTIYNFRDAQDGDFKICRVNYSSNSSLLVDSSEFGYIDVSGFSEVRAPSFYGVKKFNLHKTELVGSRALTLVRTSSFEGYSPRAVFPRNALLPGERAQVPVDKYLWLSLVRKMLIKNPV